MKNKSKKIHKSRIDSGIVTAICIILAACVLLAFSQYQASSNRLSREGAKMQLQEVADFNATAVASEMKSSMDALKMLAKTLEKVNENGSQNLTDILQELLLDAPFSRLWVVDLDGKAMSSSGIIMSDFLITYFNDHTKGTSGVTKTNISKVTGEQIICLYTPIYENGQLSGALYGIYEIKRLSAFTTLKSFSGNAEAIIIEGGGNVVLSNFERAESDEIVSLWDIIDEFNMSGMKRENVEEIIGGRASAFVEYSREGGKSATAYLRPIGFADWYLVELVPNEVITASAASFSSIAIYLLSELVIVFVIAICVIIFYGQKFRKTLSVKNEELLVKNEWLQIALANSTSGVFEYDCEEGLISECMNCFTQMGKEFSPIEFAEKYCVSGQERVALFEMFSGIAKSDKNLSATISFDENGERKFSKLTLKKVFDQTGKVVRIIGTKEDVTDVKEIQTRFDKELEYRDNILSDVKGIFDVNLESGEFTAEKFESKLASILQKNMNFMQFQKYIIENVVYVEDRHRAEVATTVNALKKAFEENVFEVKLELRLVVESEVKWYLWLAHIFLEPETNNLKGTIYVKDIDEQKKKELELYRLSSHDPLTDLYNRKRAEQSVNSILQRRKKKEDGINAFFVVDVDNFKSVNDTFGHLVGDKLLIAIAEEFKRNFRLSDVYARIGGDEFIALLLHSDSLQTVKKKANDLRNAIEKIVIDEATELKPTCSIGVAVANYSDKDFETLYKRADNALYKAKAKGKNNVFVEA